MLADSVVPEKWYSINETAKILGFSRDTIVRLIDGGFLVALVLPLKQRSRRRTYSSRRIQGAEIIRFTRKYTGVEAA
jgi:hypothetical protein